MCCGTELPTIDATTETGLASFPVQCCQALNTSGWVAHVEQLPV